MTNYTLFENLQSVNMKFMEALQLMLNKMSHSEATSMLDFKSLQQVYMEAVYNFTSNPAKFMEHNLEYANAVMNLMFSTYNRMMNTGESNGSNAASFDYDKRFKSPQWQNSAYFSFLKDFYLMSTKWHKSLIDKLDISEVQKRALHFYTDSVLNAACPANYPFMNPDVIEEMMRTNGKSLLDGIDNFLRDLNESGDMFDITRCNLSAFKLSRDIGATKGKVVMQNQVMQLICYEPTAEKVQAVPMLVVSPWINKFYILDLSESNSMVKYYTDMGFMVFIVSWVNPDSSLADISLDDYLQGILEALKFISESCGSNEVSGVGYCIGGMLLACAAAYLESPECPKDIKYRLSSLVLVATLLDFSNPGDIGLFINEATLGSIRDAVERQGYLSGKYLSQTFTMLRSNDLIWSFVINNYLLGKKPMAFDLLYWNADCTNLPAKMNMFYLENMYVNNNLVQDKIELLGVKILLKNITIPVLFVAMYDDHIVPWRSSYDGAVALSNAKVTFCVGGSGHVAGVINHPSNQKYYYMTNDSIKVGSVSADEWYSNAKMHKHSWWPYSAEWLMSGSNGVMNSPSEVYGSMPCIQDAPGDYVHVRI